MLRAVILACLAAVPATGLAANAATAQSTEMARIAAIANDKAITVHDVRSRLALIFMSAGIPDTAETRRKLRSQVLNQLIVEALQLQEAKRLGISVSDREIATALARIEQRNKIPAGQLLKTLKRRKIDPGTIIEQTRATLAWSKAIRRVVSSRIAISDSEIDEAVARLDANKERLVYRILEIYIPLDRDRSGSALRTTRRLIAQIRQGANFGSLARQFSQASTASDGGDMGFVFEGQLPAELDAAIRRVAPGQAIGPIRTATGYYLLALVSKRPYGAGTPPTRQQVANSILQRKAGVRARQYLRDLQRAAFVDIRI